MPSDELLAFETRWRRPKVDRWGRPLELVVHVRAVSLRAAQELAPVAFEQLMGQAAAKLDYQLVGVHQVKAEL